MANFVFTLQLKISNVIGPKKKSNVKDLIYNLFEFIQLMTCSDALAQMAHGNSLPTNWRWNLPQQLKQILVLDGRHDNDVNERNMRQNAQRNRPHIICYKMFNFI